MPPALHTTAAGPNSGAGLARIAGAALPATLIGAILVFIVPVPPAVLDLLLALNITLAVIILLTTLSIRAPHEFGAFPTIILTTTLTRLVLNVATTRLVLTHGADGLDAAGGVVQAFGEFVAGDNVVVGVILFAILIVIQFVVITKGATRISEVAARFMLDGLPGRQMAIDADLSAGLIDQREAQRRREAVYRQADFFGAMDGAGKFVRGDAVAGILITLINIGAGLFLGVFEHGMPVGEAVNVFTKLTIGDGLVSQIPAFLISLASGLIVTRSSEDSDIGADVVGQLFGRAEVLGASAVFLGLLALTPLPKLPLLTLAAALGSGSYILAKRKPAEDDAENEAPEPAEAAPAHPETPVDRMEELLHVDPLELEIGYRLIGLADPTRGGDLLDRLRSIRQRVARDLGLIVPQVRIRDEIGLGPHDYRLKLRGAVVGQGVAYAGRLLAVPPAGLGSRPDGRDGVDPTTGQPAVWIHADGREVAELAGCRVLEASAVVAGHFGEIVLGHADELMSRDQVGRFLDRARTTSQALVDEVVPGLLRAGEVQQVLQGLLRERVSVRDQETILETLAVHAARTKDIDVLIERVRRGLARRITQQYLGADGRLRVATLARALDARLGVVGGLDDTRPAAALGAATTQGIVRAVARAIAPMIEAGHPPIVLGSAEARPVLKDLTRADLPRLIVLSQREIPRDTPIESVGTVVEDEIPVVTSYSTAGSAALVGIGDE
ncbi:flagellar biosynthesis protein FlhA [Tundrisphaera sp. TA3]|uniref:flagellar biosynthesis protein FlhA n=1 Tax=Tundrisphaera sp. TA3 TaxID=3435775 RepID=UPI003EB973D4